MHNFDQNHTENFEYCKKESAELISLTSTDVANFMRSFYKNKIKSAKISNSFRPGRVHKIYLDLPKGPINPTGRKYPSIILYWWKISKERSKLAISKWNEIKVYTVAKWKPENSSFSSSFQPNHFFVSAFFKLINLNTYGTIRQWNFSQKWTGNWNTIDGMFKAPRILFLCQFQPITFVKDKIAFLAENCYAGYHEMPLNSFKNNHNKFQKSWPPQVSSWFSTTK